MSDATAPREVPDAERPTGPVAAAVLAVGIGSAVLGLLTTLNEASEEINDFLVLDEDVGPLSGKTVIAVVAYLASWAVLHVVWRHTDPALRPVLIATAALIGLGVLGTFPTFFEAFATE